MKIWICDSCGRKFSNEEIYLKTWFKEDLDLCKDCLEIYNKAEDEIKLEREKTIEEYETKCHKKIKKIEKEIICKYMEGKYEKEII